MSGPVDVAAWLLSHLPAAVTSFGAIGAPLLGFAGAIWLRLQLGAAGKWPALLALIAGLLIGAMMLGIAAARSVCDGAQLRREVEVLRTTIADRERRLAEYRIVIETGAAREAQAQRDIEALQSRIDDYEADVAKAAARDPGGAWRFDRARIERLCRLAPTACAAARR